MYSLRLTLSILFGDKEATVFISLLHGFLGAAAGIVCRFKNTKNSNPFLFGPVKKSILERIPDCGGFNIVSSLYRLVTFCSDVRFYVVG